MEPIIYQISRTDPITLDQNNIFFDTNRNPKLIKFGFSNITEELDLASLISVPYYTAALNFDFTRNDKESIVYLAENKLGVKNFNQTFAEFWEIINIFSLFNDAQNIISSHPDIITDIITSYNYIADKKFKGNVIKSPKKNQTATLVFYKYSDIDIDENAAIQFITDNLDWLFSIQTNGSSMVLQLYSTQTQITAELIYYISSHYEEAYLVKPSIVPEISDCIYLVLLRLRGSPVFNLPKHSKDNYLASIGIKNIATDFISTIQCFNSETMPRKYKKYYEIKTYIDSKVYEGAVYQEMINTQNDNANKWLNLFTNPGMMPKLLDDALKNSDSKCMRHSQLIKILS